jgi:hypothetical protein
LKALRERVSDPTMSLDFAGAPDVLLALIDTAEAAMEQSDLLEEWESTPRFRETLTHYTT